MRSDGTTVRVSSGRTDEWYPKVATFIEQLPARLRPALAVATHAEVKVAIALRDEPDLACGEQHVVIDKTVCGTRSFDWWKSWTCDKLLATLLPPRARLTVVQPDGTTLTYVGEEDPQ